MLFVLSTSVIADTARSLAAMRSLTMPDSEHAILSPLLDPSRRALMVNLVRQAFADTALGLMPYVSDCTLGTEDATTDPGPTPPEGPDTPDLMSIAIDLPCRLPDSSLWTIRRGLEQSVAMTALSRLVTVAGGDYAVARWLAKSFADEGRDALRAVREAVATLPQSAVQPFVRG